MQGTFQDTLTNWLIVSLATFNVTCAILTFISNRGRSGSSIYTLVVAVLAAVYALLLSALGLGLYQIQVRFVVFCIVPVCFIGQTIYLMVQYYLANPVSQRWRIACFFLPVITGGSFAVSSLFHTEQELLGLVESYAQRRFLDGVTPSPFFLISFVAMLAQQSVFYVAALWEIVQAHLKAKAISGSNTVVLIIIAGGPLVLFTLDVLIIAFDLRFDHTLVALASLPIYGLVLYKNAQLERAYHYRVERQKTEMMRYLPEDLVRKIIGNLDPTELQGRRGIGTVMFCDIRDFTSMAEDLDPMQVTVILNDYFTEMNRIIFKHGGTINKYIGDALMATFGQMDREGYAADVSIGCAFEMFKRLEELNIIWSKTGRPEIRIGIGIHRGQMIYGNVGSSERMEYTVIGDTVNTAARIAQLNSTLDKPLIFSSAVLETIDRPIAGVQLLGDFDLKGKHKKVRLFGVARSQQVKMRLVV